MQWSTNTTDILRDTQISGNGNLGNIYTDTIEDTQISGNGHGRQCLHIHKHSLGYMMDSTEVT